MSKRFRRSMLLVLALTASLSVSPTALGYVETKTKGTVGEHSLTDTTGSPGAICAYQPSATPGVKKLKHIYVNAPHMKAIAGASTEKVGWRFVIQRIRYGTSQWKLFYRSPIWTASTNSSQDASFSQEGRKVVVNHTYFETGYGYRVSEKLLWYNTAGTKVRGSATELVEWYALSEGANPGPSNNVCPDFDD